MNRPLLQIALDNLETKDAIEIAKVIAGDVDVIEVGTILIASQGKQAIRDIKDYFPDKIIIADGKIADAGKIFAKMFFKAGAHFITCICASETPTIATTLQIAKKYGVKRDVQIELTSHFSWQQVKEWKEIGVKQVVYHRSRDAQASGKKWSSFDLKQIKKLIDYGFQVSVTGGLEVADIAFFKDLPIYIFIAGRSIRDAVNPQLAAAAFQKEIAKYW